MDVFKLKNKQLALIRKLNNMEKQPAGKPKAAEMQILFDQIINLQKQLKYATI